MLCVAERGLPHRQLLVELHPLAHSWLCRVQGPDLEAHVKIFWYRWALFLFHPWLLTIFCEFRGQGPPLLVQMIYLLSLLSQLHLLSSTELLLASGGNLSSLSTLARETLYHPSSPESQTDGSRSFCLILSNLPSWASVNK